MARRDQNSSNGAAPGVGASLSSDSAPHPRDSGVVRSLLQELRPTAQRAKRRAPVALSNLKHSDILLPVRPALDRERPRPASFSNIKALQRPAMSLPIQPLSPVKLITRASLPKPAASPARSFAPAGASIPDPPLAPPPRSAAAPRQQAKAKDIGKSRHEPPWRLLFAPSERGGGRGRPDPIPTGAREAYVERAQTGFDWADAGNIEIDDLTGSRTESTQLEPIALTKRIWFWQAIEGVLLSRTFARSLAVVTVALFAGAFDMPWRDWMQKQAVRVKAPISAAVAQLSQPMVQRAAFFIVDDFTSGVDHWRSSNRLLVDPAGRLTVSEGLALHGNTTRLENYRFDFDAKIQANAVGWLVRAPDQTNYYGFKLHQSGAKKEPVFSLSRFFMLDGVKTMSAASISVPAHLARSDDFNRISVRVAGKNITTLLNGWGVDYWTDERIPRGGVGLLADAGEQALVRKMTVSGNDDTWGLLLYGALESMQSVQSFFGNRTPSGALLLFRRPLLSRQTEAYSLLNQVQP